MREEREFEVIIFSPDDLVIEDWSDEEDDECDDDPWEEVPDEDEEDEQCAECGAGFDEDHDWTCTYSTSFHTVEEYEAWEQEWHPENFEGERKEGSAE